MSSAKIGDARQQVRSGGSCSETAEWLSGVQAAAVSLCTLDEARGEMWKPGRARAAAFCQETRRAVRFPTARSRRKLRARAFFSSLSILRLLFFASGSGEQPPPKVNGGNEGGREGFPPSAPAYPALPPSRLLTPRHSRPIRVGGGPLSSHNLTILPEPSTP
ncbi:hypothetical protein MRX96_015447 [Rhipicephalus microplus]